MQVQPEIFFSNFNVNRVKSFETTFGVILVLNFFERQRFAVFSDYTRGFSESYGSRLSAFYGFTVETVFVFNEERSDFVSIRSGVSRSQVRVNHVIIIQIL